MSLIRWNDPMKLMERRNWVESFFADTNDFLKNWKWDNAQELPAVNVKEEKDFFLIEVAAPGMKKEDFKVEVDRGVLSISATTEENKEEKTDNFKRHEFSYRSFKRSFWLPENVMAGKIEAQYENGLLKLKLLKSMQIPENIQTIKVV